MRASSKHNVTVCVYDDSLLKHLLGQ